MCDNQLINNPIFELLAYDGYAKIPDFAWDTIARIRAAVFESDIRRTFSTKAEARDYETKLIERFRSMFGKDQLPGNKGNR